MLSLKEHLWHTTQHNNTLHQHYTTIVLILKLHSLVLEMELHTNFKRVTLFTRIAAILISHKDGYIDEACVAVEELELQMKTATIPI